MIPGKVRPNLLLLFNTWVKRSVKEQRDRYRTRYSQYDDEDYETEMELLRRYYGRSFPNSSAMGVILNPLDDDEWDDEDYDDVEYCDYMVDDEGEIIFPPKNVDIDTTLRPGEMRRSAQDMDDYWNKMSKFNERGKKKHSKHRGHRGSKKAKMIDINKPYNANYIDEDGNPLNETSIYFYEDYHDKYSRIEFSNLYDFDQYCKEMGFDVPSYVGENIAYNPISHCCLNPAAKENGVLEIMREETYGDMYYEACETSELSET